MPKKRSQKQQPLSNLQLLVLDQMGLRDISAIELRERLMKKGFERSRTAFYECMKRMEGAGFVESWYTVDQDGVREKNFRIKQHGIDCMGQMREFYEGIDWDGILNPGLSRS